MLEHRGANMDGALVGIHQRLAKKLGDLRSPPTGPVLLNQPKPPDLLNVLITQALRATYQEAGLTHFWEVCERWLAAP